MSATMSLIAVVVSGAGCFAAGFWSGRITASAPSLPLHDESFGTSLQRAMLRSWVEKGNENNG